MRQTSVLLLLCCAGAVYSAQALAQSGPGPEAGPGSSQTPSPDPAPGGAPAPTSGSSQQPSAPVQPASPPPPVVQAPTSAPTSTVQRERKQVQRPETSRQKQVRKGTTKQTARKALPIVAAQSAGSSDRTLMIGGLALLVLVLSDTVFLTLSSRKFRAG